MLIVILTANRNVLLRRCLTELLPCTDTDDRILVLDDSGDHSRIQSLEVVKCMATSRISYLHTADAFSFLSQACPNAALFWVRRKCRRDIAPLRNLALAVFAADEQQSICALIDDDIIPHQFGQMKCAVQDIEVASYVAGPHIGGIDEMDTITRLQRICPHLRSLRQSGTSTPAEVILDGTRVSSNENLTMPIQYGCVSAGCMFFNRYSAFDLPFPPGYNEDWNWCLMREAFGALVYRLPQVVEHAPDRLRPISADDLIFEVAGDVALDILSERNPPFCGPTWGSLREVQTHVVPALASILGAGRALFEELHAIRLKSDIARAAISHDEMAALSKVCCNGSALHIVQHVQEWLRLLPEHTASFRRFLGDYINGPLGQLKERTYGE